ncbi:MAG: adenylyl-sulfate kinase [Candidatus Latescibacterota bacterium]|nr:adenylyl-sulfate kinase [Candidatus Latescibacterota bacterium]
MNKPFVISIIGLSSSGKTTLGRQLYEHMLECGISPLQLVDGDIVREFLKGKIGYSASDRDLSASIQTQLAFVLHNHGISSIVCNISPFEKSRAFARKKIPGIIEVHLDCPLSVCIRRDKTLGKRVYEPVSKGITENVNIVGVDIEFEKPIKADLVLNTNQENPNDSFARILNFLGDRWNYEKFRITDD